MKRHKHITVAILKLLLFIVTRALATSSWKSINKQRQPLCIFLIKVCLQSRVNSIKFTQISICITWNYLIECQLEVWIIIGKFPQTSCIVPSNRAIWQWKPSSPAGCRVFNTCQIDTLLRHYATSFRKFTDKFRLLVVLLQIILFCWINTRLMSVQFPHRHTPYVRWE